MEIFKNKLILRKEMNNRKPEYMFCFIDNSAGFTNAGCIFKHSAKHKPVLIYVIQKPLNKAENVFDIFMTPKFSYLEPCNRVKYQPHKFINATTIEY